MRRKAIGLYNIYPLLLGIALIPIRAETEPNSTNAFDVNWKFNIKERYISIEVVNKRNDAIKISPKIRLGSINSGEDLDLNINPNYKSDSVIYPTIIFVAPPEKKTSFTGSSLGGRILPPFIILPGDKKIIKVTLDDNFLAAAQNSYLVKCAFIDNGKIIYSSDVNPRHSLNWIQ